MNTGGSKAVLILENGSIAEGKSFGAKGSVVGEVVFSTAMTGYQEALTDPSYHGQILCQTFPLIGNYGVNDEDNESENTAVSGYIVRECCGEPSNFRSTDELDSFLKKNGIIGIYGIDTRKLTRELCNKGVMNGMITTEEYDSESVLEKIKSYRLKDAVKSTVNLDIREYKAKNAEYKTVIIDFGCKKSFINEFLSRKCDVTVLPYNSGAEEILRLDPDGVILSSGPGDPTELVEAVQTIGTLIEKGVPLLGVGLGHQLIAAASGGKIKKLNQGHRGGNQPVIDIKSGKTYITSQNHGYTVESGTIKPEIAEARWLNANDKSCEGFRYLDKPVISVEFYPQSLRIINDTSYIFDDFITLFKNKK